MMQKANHEQQRVIFLKLATLTTEVFPYFCKSLKIQKEQSESVYRRRRDNSMAKRKSTKGQTTICKTYI